MNSLVKSLSLSFSLLMPASLLTSFVENAYAVTYSGLQLPEELKLGEKNLVLNGYGKRQAKIAFIKVDVYASGLYLEKKSQNPEEILSSPQVKHIKLRFLRDLEKKKLVDAFSKGTTENCPQDCEALKGQIQSMESYLTDVKKGDELSFTFHPERVEMQVKGEVKAPIAGGNFSRSLLGAWLGPKPADEGLKKALLGVGK